MDLSGFFRKKEKRKGMSQLPDCIKGCPVGGEGCPIVQRLIKETDISETAVGLKLEIDKKAKSVQEQINKERKEVDKKIGSWQKELGEQKDKDREYTWARTCQIGLLTMNEARRIHEFIHLATPRTTIEAVDFDVYGIDKYFGMKYNNCVEQIWKIKEDCRNYDRIIAIDNEEILKKLLVELNLTSEKDPIDKEKTVKELGNQIGEDAVAIWGIVFKTVHEIFKKIDFLNIGKYHRKKDQDIIKEDFKKFTNMTEVKTHEIKKMMEFFGKIIHDIIAGKLEHNTS